MALGKVGAVLGLEVSRLARSCVDWYRLLEVTALSGTLIADEEGVYDPNHYNDRLLLELKGTLSEAELHFIKQRMIGGRRAKANLLKDKTTETVPNEIEVIDVSKYQPKKVPSLTWRECIKKIWKQDPLICPEC